MEKPKEHRGRGHPPKEIDLVQLEALAAMHATYEEVAAVLKVTKRTIINRLKDPELLFVFESGKHRGKLNLRRLQWRLAQGLDANGNPVNGSQSAAVNMAIHLSKHWLGETDKTAHEVNPIELVITRIERVIVDSSPDRDRQSLPPVIEVKAVQGR